MRLRSLPLLFALFLPLGLWSQDLSLADIWSRESNLWPAEAPTMVLETGGTYLQVDFGEGGNLITRRKASGVTTDTLYQGLLLSQYGIAMKAEAGPKGLILLEGYPTTRYRHSYTAQTFLINPKKDPGPQLFFADEISHATFSPNGRYLAFQFENNLYVYDIERDVTRRLTRDGEPNQLICGSGDWVYEEEFETVKAFEFSPDSKHIAFLRFDESLVEQYPLVTYPREGYPQVEWFKYPRVGEKNSTVELRCLNVESAEQWTVATLKVDEEYLPRFTWAGGGSTLAYLTLDRKQKTLRWYQTDALRKIAPRVIFEEKSETYVDIPAFWEYAPDGSQAVFTSEKDGYLQAYLLDGKGKVSPITTGKMEISDVAGVDWKEKMLFYTRWTAPDLRDLHCIDIAGKKGKAMKAPGSVASVEMAPDGGYLVLETSSYGTPPMHTVASPAGKTLQLLESNEALEIELNARGFQKPIPTSFEASDGTELTAYAITPKDFDPKTKKYPVLVYSYGGPGYSVVQSEWGGPNYLWFQYLASQGILVYAVDPRGTGHKGTQFKKQTYKQLGVLESEDMAAVAEQLNQLPYVEAGNLAIWGWSYGGYLTCMTMTMRAGSYKAGIAVAPLAHWKFYDSAYGERFMQTPADNPEGYIKSSPLTYVDRMSGSLLLVHGTADDNVHIQNSYRLQEALLQADKDVTPLYYPDRNHGIYGGRTRLDLYERMTAYLKEQLLQK